MPSRLIPEKKSLVARSADVLREHIASGDWENYLPPEVELAARMQIGRNTLRRALSQLTSEGLIESGCSGRRRRILSKPTDRTEASLHPVYFLNPTPPEKYSPYVLRHIDEIRLLLHDAGYRLQPITCKAFQLKHPGKVLDRLIEQHPASAWILNCCNEPVQRYFSRHSLPAIVLGMPYPDVTLPSVSQQVAAATRHAAGMLLSKGHRRICFLRADQNLAGSLEMERGFFEAFEQRQSDETLPVVKTVSSEIPSLCRTLDKLFSGKNPPTALVVEKVSHVPTIMTHFAQKGILVPRDLSLVALFEDLVLDYLVPPVAHYRSDPRKEVKSLVTTLLTTIEQGAIHTTVKSHTPEFVPGESLGVPNSSSETS